MFKLCGLQFLLAVQWATCQNLGDLHLTGPLKDMNFSIPEGTGVRAIYQFTSESPNVIFRATGEKDGLIDILPDTGTLYLNGSLDWETKAVHNLQVESLDKNGEVVKGPCAVTIYVEDINDNPPKFDQTQYTGIVRQNSRAGKPFMRVHATDLDDPRTPHAQLNYSILHHFPNPYAEMLFQINSLTGEISPSRTGSYYLDPQKQDTFTLVVSVKDMAGMTENAFKNSVDVIITVKESLWKAPPTITIKENSTQPHPVNISQVQSNEPDVIYEVFEKENLGKLPFSIDQNGFIYVTEPLDREEKDAYSFFVITKDKEGELVDKPLKINIVVEDINDNPPVCQNAVTILEVQENESGGSSIGTLSATDNDQEDTLNSRLKFKILSQDPAVPTSNLFFIQQDTGVLQLYGHSLNKRVASNYSLKVQVTDEVFQTICDVQIHVIDINDQIPIFEKSDYHNVTVPESLPVGTVLLEIQATDGDEPATGSSHIIYQVKEGDPNNVFIIETDFETNRGFLKINKALDFETAEVHNLVINATNPEPLVSGVQYNASSLTLFKVFVTNVDEPPAFHQEVYTAELSEDVPVNTLVTTVEAHDPEGDAVRYSLEGDWRKWLRIDSTTGQIYTASALDREQEQAYRVNVVASEINNAAQKFTAPLVLNLKDVNDNPPRLNMDYPVFFCYPLRGGEKALIQATDDDEQKFYTTITFSLKDDIDTRNNWEISKVNATHAYLSPKHTNFEEKVYTAPMIINDNGVPQLEREVALEVSICTCSSENSCFIQVEREHSKPSTGQAIGILLGVLIVIGAIIGGAFFHMKYKEKNKKKSQQKDAKDQSESDKLNA
ncbi:cadherin-17 [Centrocercus urophasianus]|uniref:cadherin-17 n=1 Tax=Centrocercus urophasianus TaxID=9002 RepID=UPI001C648FE1|nr:cadherin-17 [Centrocercus urophasianus]XP_042695871.1 cadherin-17 [Centrocercus urophasianus]